MKTIDNSAMRFFDADPLIRKSFDFSLPATNWMTFAKVSEKIGVPVTLGSSIQIGKWASKNGVKTRRSNGVTLIAMPPFA